MIVVRDATNEQVAAISHGICSEIEPEGCVTEVLANSWSDEARAASLAVRRAKAAELRESRDRAAFLESRPGSGEAEWQADVERRRVAREAFAVRSRAKWMRENPGATEAEWEAEVSRRESYRREKQREYAVRKSMAEFYEANPGANWIDWQIDDELRKMKWKEEQERQDWLDANPGGTEEQFLESLLAERGEYREGREVIESGLHEEQRTLKRDRDEPFVRHWEARGADGAPVPSWYDEETGELVPLPREAWPAHLREREDLEEGDVVDPHWGDWSNDAPYGYSDETGLRRSEPLYDVDGYPILPIRRQKLRSTPEGTYWTVTDEDGAEAMNNAEDRFQDAMQKWGRWGEKGKMAGFSEKFVRQYVDGTRAAKASMNVGVRLDGLRADRSKRVRDAWGRVYGDSDVIDRGDRLLYEDILEGIVE